MKKHIHYETVSAPTAFVTKGKQRVKQYGNTIYLNDGDQFEIELFNPTQSKILAKIKLNGSYISTSGIILRPGERAHLERYIDDAKKFLFDTYEVDGNDSNTKHAIQKNGLVEVEFYQEQTKPDFRWSTTYAYYSTPTVQYGGISNPSYTADNTGYSIGTTDKNINAKIGNAQENISQCYYMNAGNFQSFDALVEKPVETGRIEQGAHSNQDFDYDSTQFNSWHTWKIEWKILPKSHKNVVREDLVEYCTGCGAKRKKTSHNFCPHCGTKF